METHAPGLSSPKTNQSHGALAFGTSGPPLLAGGPQTGPLPSLSPISIALGCGCRQLSLKGYGEDEQKLYTGRTLRLLHGRVGDAVPPEGSGWAPMGLVLPDLGMSPGCTQPTLFIPLTNPGVLVHSQVQGSSKNLLLCARGPDKG